MNKIMSGFPVQPEHRVPIEHWDRAPWNRWSFQNVREIVPTAEIWRGDGDIWVLPHSPADLTAIAFPAADGSRLSLPAFFDTQYTDGMLVIHSGAIIHESYHNDMSPRSLHLSLSLAKSVIGTITGILVTRGLMNPEALVTEYLPELENTAYRGATLRDALNMASGVSYIEDYDAPDSGVAVSDIASGWKPPRPGVAAPSCIWEQILALKKMDAAHGERFSYRSIETDVIAQCMERVTKTRLPALISHELWQSLGCEESASITVDRAGYGCACGGLNATLRDYGRFGLMLANSGQAKGRQVLPPDWIRDTCTSEHNLQNDSRKRLFPNGGYRNQFWLRDVSTRILMARGVHGQLIYVDPDNELVVVILSSWPEPASIDRSITALNLVDAIAATL
jgi:CubicO group peptidase (beta-lactamase class C family)